jgi:hypothetical protein
MVQSTHSVEIGDTEVVKRFRSSDRGEADREWGALVLLHRHAPGLAPTPGRFDRDDETPTVVMSRVPGSPLGSAALSGAQVDALGEAMRALLGAVPASAMRDVPVRRSGPGELAGELRSWCREPHRPCGSGVEAALADATRWIGSRDVVALTAGPLADTVFGLGDGNIGNFLWDGQRCRVVDVEDSGASDPAYEVADVVEHATVALPDLMSPDDLIEPFGFDPAQSRRLLEFRRLMATFWLLMLVPGNPAHPRNPQGSVDRQAERLLALLDATA